MLGLHMQHYATGHHDLELWTGSEELCHLDGGVDHVLEVVQQQQELLLSEKHFQQVEQWLLGELFDVEHVGDGRHDEPGIANGSQIDEIHPIAKQLTEIGCHLKR